MALTDCQAADCISVQIQLTDLLCMLDTDIFVDRTLVNTKEHLMLIDRIRQAVQSCHLVFAAMQPSCRTLYRTLDIFSFCHTGRTLIKCHGDRGRQIGLDLHALFRSHENLSAVYMGIEIYAFFFDLSKTRQRKYLKSTGVCQDRFVPYHKFMQSAHLFYNLITRSYVKVIGVGQLHLCADLLQILGRYCSLDCCCRSDIHKNRGLYHAMHGVKLTPFCVAISFYQFIHDFLQFHSNAYKLWCILTSVQVL